MAMGMHSAGCCGMIICGLQQLRACAYVCVCVRRPHRGVLVLEHLRHRRDLKRPAIDYESSCEQREQNATAGTHGQSRVFHLLRAELPPRPAVQQLLQRRRTGFRLHVRKPCTSASRTGSAARTRACGLPLPLPLLCSLSRQPSPLRPREENMCRAPSLPLHERMRQCCGRRERPHPVRKSRGVPAPPSPPPPDPPTPAARGRQALGGRCCRGALPVSW